MNKPIMKLALAAAVIAVVILGMHELIGPSRSAGVAWADVAERFESVPFFNVTIYAGGNKAGLTKRVQIWKSEDSRVRAHEGDTILLADFTSGQREITTYDRSTLEPIHTQGLAVVFLNFLCPKGQFSLETLVAAISDESLALVPVETPDTAASREIAIFEAKRDATGETVRVWTLRDSKLPIQMQFRDPRDGEYGDFIFDYTQRKDAAFFDAKSLER